MHDSGDLLLAIADGVDHRKLRSWPNSATSSAERPQVGPLAEEITLYNSVGIAMQDIAIGSLLLARARQKGVGLEIDLGA